MPLDELAGTPIASLGRVGVWFLFYDTEEELKTAIAKMAASGHVGPDARQQIILVVPDRLRRMLNWPATSTPRPSIHSSSLVFDRTSPPV